MKLSKLIFTIGLILSLIGISITPTNAVEFIRLAVYTDPTTQEKGNYIIVHGPIVEGDYDKIVKAYEFMPDVKGMWFSGPGGELDESMKIADFINKNKIPVVIPPMTICASACALIALASPDRTMYVTSRLGLHRAYTIESDAEGNVIRKYENDETKAINLVIAMKLERWGSPMFIIAKWLSTSPLSDGGMFWIDAPTNLKYKLGFKLRMDPEKFPLEKFDVNKEKG